MDDRQIKQIAILGGGVTGWMSAAYLAQMLGKAVSITLIETQACDPTNLDTITRPAFKAFLATLGIPEPLLVQRTQGSMSVGGAFVNWGQLGNRCFHPYGQYGAEFDIVPLHQWWLKARAEDGDTPDLEAFSLAAAMARDSHFALPSADRQMVQSTFDYGFQVDGGRLAQLLAAHASTLGVVGLTGELAQAETDGQNGFIRALTLADGQRVAADFFIDCTGQQALLLQGALNVGFEDWSDLLPCDRALVIETARGGSFAPCTRNTARAAGWQSRVVLQSKSIATYCFASEQIDEAAALGDLMDDVDGKALTAPVAIAFTNGRAKQAACKNVVALGGAAGFLEPLEPIGLHMIQSGLMRLLALWPDKAFSPVVSDEYSRVTAEEWDSARDFLFLHYHVSTRTDSDFWRARAAAILPDSLASRLAQWRTCGRWIAPRPEMFGGSSWLSVCVGQGLLPDAWDPLADVRAEQVDYKGRLKSLARAIEDASAAMPSHQDWLDRHARA
ncbi:MAG: hypothetical protein RLZZ157_282 [Pseudomonadota bacterium]|jgi:tryptophan halogenase